MYIIFSNDHVWEHDTLAVVGSVSNRQEFQQFMEDRYSVKEMEEMEVATTGINEILEHGHYYLPLGCCHELAEIRFVRSHCDVPIHPVVLVDLDP